MPAMKGPTHSSRLTHAAHAPFLSRPTSLPGFSMPIPPEQPLDRQFTNADSYGVAFDAVWEKLNPATTGEPANRELTLQQAIAELSDHPFAISKPELVMQVALFRLRLRER